MTTSLLRSIRMKQDRESPAIRLNDMWQEKGESLKRYFTCFSVKLIICEMILNEKARDVLWNGLLMETPFWPDVRNNNAAFCHLKSIYTIKVLKILVHRYSFLYILYTIREHELNNTNNVTKDLQLIYNDFIWIKIVTKIKLSSKSGFDYCYRYWSYIFNIFLARTSYHQWGWSCCS